MLEEDVGILRHASCHGRIRIEGTAAEVFKRLAVDERGEVVLVEGLDLLNLVGCAEAVEEVDERHTALECGKMSHSREIHHLLHGTLAKHRETGLSGRHHVLMVAENAERMGCERTCRDMEDAGKELACDLIHIGNHKQQTLRGGVGRGQRPCLQRAVNGTGGATLALHLLHIYCLTENVLSTCSRPVIDVFCHCRRRGNRVYCRHLSKHVADVSRSLIAVACQKLLLFAHKFILLVYISF